MGIPHSVRLILLATLALPYGAAQLKTVSVRGTVMPIGEERRGMRVARIRIDSLVSCFSETVQSSWSDGRFRFDAVPEGFYALSALSARGEVRRVVDLRLKKADSSGRVQIGITTGSGDGAWDFKRRFTVRVPDISVSKSSQRDYLVAEAYTRALQFDRAIAHLERAVKTSPSYVAAWNRLGILAFHSGRFAQAEYYIRQGLNRNSTDYECLFALGRILMAQNRLEEALSYNKAALEQWSDDALANAQFGLNLLLLGEMDRAGEYLQYARRLDPDNMRNPQFWFDVYPLKSVIEILSGR